MADNSFMVIMRPFRQQTWGLAAVINFWLGGMASGAYIIATTIVTGSEHKLSGTFQLFLLFLVGAGFFFLAFHIGKPGRIKFAASHIGSSWMARETAAGLLFFFTAGWYYFFMNDLAGWFAVLAACLFLISQSFILYKGKGVSGWDLAAVPLHFTLSSFSSGSGLLLLVAPFRTADTFRIVETTGIVLVLANIAVWLFYIYKPPSLHNKALSSLRDPIALMLIIGGGMLLPLILLMIMISQVSEELLFNDWMRISEIIAGLSLIGGGLLQKYFVVKRAGWNKEILLK